MTILSRIAFPEDEQLPKRHLYFRPEGDAVLRDGAIFLDTGAKVRFNTYFNAFFYPKYLRFTQIASVRAGVCTTGRLVVRLVCQGQGDARVIAQAELTGQRSTGVLPPCRLEELPEEGALFLEVEALSPDAVLHAGWYETEETPIRPVKVAVVICTYRRESYVERNLARLEQRLWGDAECPARESADVFVIDNGNTLPQRRHPHIQVFPNRNYGGSGGFTRGLIEAYRRKDVYTHVLFMDDDISFEIESLVKTVQLLKFARELDRPLCIGGQMLIEDQPTIQFEAGAFYLGGRLSAVNRGLDLAPWENVLRNEAEGHVQYNAWWYCCLPLEAVDQVGLPLPLFIKTDDVEYGLRLHPHVLLMDGIGVWHMAFGEKYSPHLEYYIKRNELVVSALHHSGDGFLPSAWKLLRASGKAILVGKPTTVRFLLRACRDFLQGPDFFLRTDEETLNRQLLEQREHLGGERRWAAALAYPFRAVPVLAGLLVHYGGVRRSYRQRLGELTSLAFWCEHLGVEGLENAERTGDAP